ncbi:MAG: hypothetical protein PWQ91_466 [Eubacteriales bacterium]|nr:hypothetical protein [Eubacteriales bacterium]
MRTGVIIFGHGSKAPAAMEMLTAIRDMVQPAAGVEAVTVAAMQFNRPDLAEAIQDLVAKGMEKIIVVPFFLYFGVHMQEDIPALLAEERRKYPGVEIVLTDNLGPDPRLAEIVLERIRAAC